MDFSTTVVEAGATLRDPHFAFGFFTTALLLCAASFCAVFFWRSPGRLLQILSGASALGAVLLALGTRGFISILANIAVKASSGDNVIVHYWYSRPYVWSVWSLAGLSVVAALVARARRHGQAAGDVVTANDAPNSGR